jgi:hypothetical protein
MTYFTAITQAASLYCLLLPMHLDDPCPQLLVSLQRPLIYLIDFLDLTMFLLK